MQIDKIFSHWQITGSNIGFGSPIVWRSVIGHVPCPLCKREQETGAHVFFKCRYTIRLWRSVIAKLGLTQLDTSDWHLHTSVYEWWDRRTDNRNPNRQLLPPSPCLSLGPFGMRGMIGFSTQIRTTTHPTSHHLGGGQTLGHREG